MTTTRTPATTWVDATAEQSWVPDILDGFECLRLPLEGPLLSDDEELCATLVRRTRVADPKRDERRGAVLWIPGWNDYFFHAHVADFFAGHGLTLYAIDPRRAGRSLRDAQFRDFVTDLDVYEEELDTAASLIRAQHPTLVVMAHSTGGLIASLWAARRPGLVDALVLNSPWLTMWGPPGYGSAILPPVRALSRRDPLTVIPLPSPGDRYVATIHSTHHGDFDYDLTLKSAEQVPVRSGWLRAVLLGHRRLNAGLHIEAPVFVGLSTRSFLKAKGFSKRAQTSDIVLDVDNLAAKAHRLGDCVTVCRIPDGIHDLTLSVPHARQRFFDELGRWLDAYVPVAQTRI